MSLKAKIEAVIYAAEEPVTLAQLISLLSHEAQAELDRIASAQKTLDLDSLPAPSEPDLLNDEILRREDDDELADEGKRERGPGSQVGEHAAASGDPDLAAESVPVRFPRGAGTDDSQADVTGKTNLQDSRALPESLEPVDLVDPLLTPQAQTDLVDSKQLAVQERERARAVRDLLRSLLGQLIRDFAVADRGLEIREVAGGFRLATKPEYHDVVRGFVKGLKPPLKLTLQALETLAVIAYKQPVTAPEISEIRGVDSGGVLGSLMARKLVTTAGRKQVIGRPILYRTTKDFLLRFGLRDISELPSIEEFEKIAGELPGIESIEEERSMPQHTSAESVHADPELVHREDSVESSVTGANLEQEKDATEPQADGDGSTVETVTPDGRLSGITPPSDPAGETNTSAQEADVRKIEQRN